MHRRLLTLCVLVAVAAAALVATGRPAAATAGIGPLAESVALVDQATGIWYSNRPGPGTTFYYGDPGDEPFLGDWDCDGEATPGLYRRSDGYVYLRNSNSAGIAEIRFYFGNPDDLPVAGDFDGDGCDTVSLYRPGESRVYVINRLGYGDRGLGAADYSFPFGNATDLVFAGDFDGDGIDTLAAYRPSSSEMFVVADAAGTTVGASFAFGDPGDRPLAVPTLNGHAAVAVYRPGTRQLIFHGDGSAVDLSWADSDWVPVAGPFKPVVPAPPPSNTGTDRTVYVGESIQAAVDANPAGATITIKPGVHRLQQVVPKDGQTFVGEHGAVLNGARVLTGFKREGDVWVIDGQHQQAPAHGVCDERPDGSPYSGCRHAEDVFIDDVLLWQVTDRSRLAPGRWYFDYGADRIYIADDPIGHRVEVSVARHAFAAWRPGMGDRYVSNVTIRGLVIEKYANRAQFGAVRAAGAGNGAVGQGLSTGWTVVGNEIRLNHGAGVRTGHATRVSGNYIHHNGHLGIAVRGTGVEVSGNEISYNNTARFEVGWDAGGLKATLTRGLVVRDNYVHHNHGFGLWTDVNNIDTLYEGNTVADNYGAGIFHEISYAAKVLDNVVTGNGAGTHKWFYGAGILIAHSPDVEVAGNYVAGNADGIAGIQQERGDGLHGPHRLDNLWVHDNHVEMSSGYNGVGQDMGDTTVFDRNIRFDRNVYVIHGVEEPFAWRDRAITADEWRAYGHDTSGL